jgi:predicted dehydrogenase
MTICYYVIGRKYILQNPSPERPITGANRRLAFRLIQNTFGGLLIFSKTRSLRSIHMKKINVGLIGFGYIGKIHTIAYRDIALALGQPKAVPHLAALLRSRLDTESEAMQGAGFMLTTTDPDEFYAQALDMVDICTPNFLHLEQCQRAFQAGAAVYCEKPLAKDLEEALKLVEMAAQAQAITQVAFVMRYIPAIRQMKALIEAGEIGEVFSFRGHMYHGSYLDPNRPMSWRLRMSESGGGAFMDLGAHLVDLTHYLLGEVASVRADMRTFIGQRPIAKGSDKTETVDVDDWTTCVLELKRGAVGTIEATRMAAGAHEDSVFQVFGSKGALHYAESNPNSVRLYSLKRGDWITGPGDIPAIPGERPVDQLWPSGKYSQGSFTNAHLAAEYDFLLNVAENRPSQVDFRAGAAAQAVVEAATISARRGGELYKLE